MKSATFIVAGALDQRTGGFLYDAAIIAAMRDAGWSVEVIELVGRFPWPDAIASDALDRALTGLDADRPIVIDALACGALPDVIERHAPRLPLTVLVHHPLADETGLDTATAGALQERERRVLACAARIVTTSVFTAERLCVLGLTTRRAAVVEPGTASAALAHGSTDAGCRLLCVATMVPRKGHPVLIDALARLVARDWICDLVGDDQREPAHARAVSQAVSDAGLGARIHLHGSLDERALAERYARADLFVLPSYYEGYGMVISEAIAHGLAIVTTTGGALGATLPAGAGIAVPPGNTDALAAALADMIDNPGQRAAAAAAARRARAHLRSWHAAGTEFARALETPAVQASHA